MRQIEYYLTKSDYQEFYVVACARRLWKFCLLLGALLTGLNVWSDYFRCRPFSADVLIHNSLSGFGIAAAACFGVLMLNLMYARQIHRAMEPIAKGQRLSWDDEAIHVGSDFFSSAYPWPLFSRTTETKHVIAAYLTPVSPLLFPKRVMTSEELAELRRHLRSIGTS